MSVKVKDIYMKNRTYSFFIDIINRKKNFNPSNIKIDKKSSKNIFFYYIGYVTIKEYVQKMYCNRLVVFFRNMNRHFEEIGKNKYLTLQYSS